MRILVLNYEFPPVGGGGGQVSADLCRLLAGFGHELRVQTAWVPGLPRQEARDGYLIHRAWAGRRRIHTCTVPEMGVFVAANFVPALRQALVWRPQVVQAHFAVPTGLVAWLIRRLTGLPYLLSAYLGDVPGGVPAQTDRLFRWLTPFTAPIWREASAVTVPCRFVAGLAQRAYGVPVQVVPHGIDLEPLKPRPPLAQRPPRLVFAGRLSTQKNPLFLLEVLARLTDLDWRLDLVGDGPLRGEVADLIQRRRLGARVQLHGWVRLDALTAIMRHSDILVMPSLAEGIPLVGLQALGLGLALAASDHGGLTDLVQDGLNGFTCSVTDIDAFVRRLRGLLQDPEALSAMKRASLARAPRFEAQRLARQMEALLAAVARKRGCGDEGGEPPSGEAI